MPYLDYVPGEAFKDLIIARILRSQPLCTSIFLVKMWGTGGAKQVFRAATL